HLEPFCFAVWELVYEAITELCLLCFAYFYLVLFISQAKGSNSSSVKNSALKEDIDEFSDVDELYSSLPLDKILLQSPPGYLSVYSGTVAGAPEAFFNDIPAISVLYDWVKGKSNVHDFILAAQACIPIISAVLVEIKNQ
ncbi:hypothetical protein S83_043728, partial [Arachis hypogaea]